MNFDDEIKKKLLQALMNGDGEIKVLGEIGGSKRDERPPTKSAIEQADRLIELRETFLDQEDIKAGDLITIKDNKLSCWRSTKEGNVLLVLEKLPEPRYGFEFEEEGASAGNHYSSIRYDIIAGRLDNDGDFITHLYDSRRFKKYHRPASNVKPIKI